MNTALSYIWVLKNPTNIDKSNGGGILIKNTTFVYIYIYNGGKLWKKTRNPRKR